MFMDCMPMCECTCLVCSISTSWKWSLVLNPLQWAWLTGHSVNLIRVETWTYNLWTQDWSQKTRSRGFYLFHFHSIQAQLNLSLIELSTLILQAHLKNPSTPLPSKMQVSLFLRRCSCLPLPHPSLALLLSLPVLLSMNMLLLTLKTSHQMGLGIHSAPQLPICFQSRGREIHRHKGAFVLLPSGLWCPCGWVPQGEAQIKTSLQKTAITWPPMIPPGTHN